MKKKINATIIVEGKNDIAAVKRSVDCEIIATNGLGINDNVIELIKSAAVHSEIIILTDADFSGNKIRNIISKEVPEAKHAFIKKEYTVKNAKVGVENASPDVIQEALKNSHQPLKKSCEFTFMDLFHYGLIGSNNSADKRKFLCDFLNIGHCSGKKLLERLNNFNISRDNFIKAIETLKTSRW